jgi:hypothetical protein
VEVGHGNPEVERHSHLGWQEVKIILQFVGQNIPTVLPEYLTICAVLPLKLLELCAMYEDN